MLSLDKRFGLVKEVNVLHIELVQLVQVVVQDYMQVLLNLLPRKIVDIVVAINEPSHVIEKLLFFWLELGHVLLYSCKLILHNLRRLMRQTGL